MRRFTTTTIVAAILLGCSIAAAQAGPVHGRSDRGIQLRLGGFFPEGESEFWGTTSEDFTLDVSDFDEVTLGVTYLMAWNNHTELGVNIDFYDATVVSDYTDFVDAGGFPIFHDTNLSMVPMTFDVRFLPFGRYRIRGGGRQVLQPAFYIGAGAGVKLWEYEEVGDFIDFSNPAQPIFSDRLNDDGAALETHAVVGVELPVGSSFNVMLEGRYSWSDDDLGRDFGGFGEIDLGGPSVYAGASWRF